MPIRTLAILAALLGVTCGVFALAWLTGAELYFFLPLRNGVQPPPTHPAVVGCFLGIPFIVAIYSRHYGALVFAVFPAGLLLGSIVGFGVLQWTPSVCQHLLCVSALATAGYAWSQREYLDY